MENNLPEHQKTELQTQSQELTHFLDQQAGKAFNSTDKEIAIAIHQPNIRNYTEDVFHNKMVVLIGSTHLKCGFPHDTNQTALTVNELCEDLKKYNGTLSFEEIELAFKNGYKEVYGKFFGLNNKTYFQWINAYAYGQNRLRVTKMIQDAKEKENNPTVKTQEEIDEIMKCAILKSFNDFKSGIRRTNSAQYNFLKAKELINFTLERKNEILASVKKQMHEEAIFNKSKTESIKQAIEKIKPETEISRAKSESVLQYFKDLVDTGMEISDMLD